MVAEAGWVGSDDPMAVVGVGIGIGCVGVVVVVVVAVVDQ